MSAFVGKADIAREDDQLIVSCELCGLAKNFNPLCSAQAGVPMILAA